MPRSASWFPLVASVKFAWLHWTRRRVWEYFLVPFMCCRVKAQFFFFKAVLLFCLFQITHCLTIFLQRKNIILFCLFPWRVSLLIVNLAGICTWSPFLCYPVTYSAITSSSSMPCYPSGFLAPFLNFMTAAEICIVSEEISIEVFLWGRGGRLCFVIALTMEKSFARCCRCFLCYSRGGMLLSG